MSGGHFDYDQFRITDIISQLLEDIDNNDSKEKTEWGDDISRHFTPKTIEEFKTAVQLLAKAHIYAHRIDWLLSGDDGEETFHQRLKKDLDNMDELIEDHRRNKINYD